MKPLRGHQAGRPLGPLDGVVDVEQRRGRRPSPRSRRAGRRSGSAGARRGTPCRGGRAARRRPSAARGRRGRRRRRRARRPTVADGGDRARRRAARRRPSRRRASRPAAPAPTCVAHRPKLPTGTARGPCDRRHARCLLLRRRRAGRRRCRPAGADGPPGHATSRCGRRRPTTSARRSRPSASATTRSGRPSTTSSTRATRSSRTASSSRRGSPPAPQRLRLGTMFNVVPQWNPLRLAEDFSTLHNLSGGRGILGVGRGTVPREVLHLNDKGVSIGSHDNPDQAADDDRNRRVFEESMEIVRLALAEETFSYHGEFFQIPVPGIPDRGSTVQYADAGAAAAVPVRDLAGRHQPADARVRPGRRPRRRVLEPAPRVHQALLGHLRRALRRGPRRPRAGAAREADARRRRCASRTPTRRRSRRRRPATTSSGSSSARTGGAAATWAPTASRRQPGLIPTLAESIENKTILARHARGGRRGRRLLPRPARPRAPDDLPAPPRRPVQEGRRADGPLRRGGRPARR